MPFGHEAGHLAVEEGHKQGPDVGTIDIGVAHHDHLPVPPLGWVFFLTDPVAHGRNDVANLLVAENTIKPGALDVEDFAAQGKDGLVKAVATALSRAPG
jgi:hypothetical protein